MYEECSFKDGKLESSGAEDDAREANRLRRRDGNKRWTRTSSTPVQLRETRSTYSISYSSVGRNDSLFHVPSLQNFGHRRGSAIIKLSRWKLGKANWQNGSSAEAGKMDHHFAVSSSKFAISTKIYSSSVKKCMSLEKIMARTVFLNGTINFSS